MKKEEEEEKEKKNKYIVSIPTSALNVRSNLLQVARPRQNWHFAGEIGGRGKHQAGEGSQAHGIRGLNVMPEMSLNFNTS